MEEKRHTNKKNKRDVTHRSYLPSSRKTQAGERESVPVIDSGDWVAHDRCLFVIFPSCLIVSFAVSSLLLLFFRRRENVCATADLPSKPSRELSEDKQKAVDGMCDIQVALLG